MSKVCFVIQPFDNGKFDARYRETYKPAIISAGYLPYRVDEDPSSGVPIQAIEEGIRDASVCFADISPDNPNVWFEVGLAIAFRQEICLVCSDERQKFPFDVQHRSIIKYSTQSRGSFDELQSKIEARLKAISVGAQKSETIKSQLIASNSDISESELNILGVVGGWSDGFCGVAIFEISSRMENFGYNNLATNTAIRKLISKKFIDRKTEWDSNQEYSIISLTEHGWKYIEDNSAKFVMQASKRKQKSVSMPVPDDDIPF